MEGPEARENRNGVLPVRPWFKMVWAGYDRKAVDRHLRAMEDELQLLTADRDFAARTADKLTVELDALRAAHEELKLRYDRACRSPIEADGLSERMLRMVELAHVEANEIVQNARTKAERTRTAADEEARRLRGRYERKLHELEQRRAAMEAEHAELMRTSRAEFEEKERQAEERRRRLDEESARRRQQAERDLALVLKARREEATKAIEQREAESKERAATLVAEAESRAADMIAQATERVRELEEVQRQLTGRLREARDVLAAAMPLTAPLPEETAEPALAHARPGSGEDEPVADDVRADSAREVRPGVPPAGVRSARAGVVEVPEQRTDEVEPAEVPSVGAGSSDEALSGEAVSAGSASETASEEAEVSGPVSTRREDRDRKPSVDSPVRPVVAAPGRPAKPIATVTIAVAPEPAVDTDGKPKRLARTKVLEPVAAAPAAQAVPEPVAGS